MATSPTTNLPTRSATGDDTVAPAEDASEVTKLFHERLQAYKHACRYLEDYISATEKVQKAQSKEYEKVLKTVNQPLKEGEMFDRNLGGIAEMFDSIRANTLNISSLYTESSKSLDSGVLPMFKRLHAEIKTKQSELAKGGGKATKAVDKAKADTNKYVERLGTASASYTSPLGKPDPNNDPYVIQRGILYRLNKQIVEENSAKQDMLAIQDGFSQFESHVVKSFQAGMGAFMQTIGSQIDQQKAFYSTMTEKSQSVDPLFEWNGFVQRNSHLLIDPNAPPKTLQNTTFANKDHQSTQPMCQGALERKHGLMGKYSPSYFVVTPARFLHEFSSEDDLSKDPTPEMSLYLPDCSVGGIKDSKFSVKGKDISSTMSKLGQSKEYEFKARTGHDAETWWGIIRGLTTSMPSSDPSSPMSPTGSVQQRVASNASQTGASPVAASPPQQAIPAAAPATAAPVVAAPVAAAPEAATTLPPPQQGAVPASAASAEAAQAQGLVTDVKP